MREQINSLREPYHAVFPQTQPKSPAALIDRISGGQQQAEPDVGRPLDGTVRPHHRSRRCSRRW
jgi:hypothetical protein